jgi:hypothetical protein
MRNCRGKPLAALALVAMLLVGQVLATAATAGELLGAARSVMLLGGVLDAGVGEWWKRLQGGR